jgi:cell division protein FtsW
MIRVPRTDTSLLGRWWWTVDRWTLAAVVLLMIFGTVLIMSVSPAAAQRIDGLATFQLAQRQILFLTMALATVIAISLLDGRSVRRLGVLGMGACLLLLVATLVGGSEIKGATRWLNLGGLSIQASEFAKPCLAVTAAWMLACQKQGEGVPGMAIAAGLWLLLVGLLLAQPDIGQTFVISAIFGLQLFLAGLPMILVGALSVCGAAGLVGAYFLYPHFTARIDGFFDNGAGSHYQIERSLDAFSRGGFFGRGPGEGSVKAQLPDAHADFIFAVAGEELGVIACLIIVGLFAFIVLRGFSSLLREDSIFVLLAGTGLLAQFGLQALINMASAVHLIPTKGMTLPFISYGGSSLLALAIGMGMVLALTRRRAVPGEVL